MFPSALSLSVISDSLRPPDHSPPGPSVHGGSPGKNTGVGCDALLQGVFATQGWNPGLLHCRQVPYHLSYQGSPRILEWVANPSSRDLPNPGIELGSPALQAESLPAEPPGKPWQAFLTRSLFVMFPPSTKVHLTSCRNSGDASGAASGGGPSGTEAAVCVVCRRRPVTLRLLLPAVWLPAVVHGSQPCQRGRPALQAHHQALLPEAQVPGGQRGE